MNSDPRLRGLAPTFFLPFFSHGNFVNCESLYVEHPKEKVTLFSDLELTTKLFKPTFLTHCRRSSFSYPSPQILHWQVIKWGIWSELRLVIVQWYQKKRVRFNFLRLISRDSYDIYISWEFLQNPGFFARANEHDNFHCYVCITGRADPACT